jgi:hypothetical protein
MKLPARSRRSFIVRAGETRPAPVIPAEHPSPSPLPTGADLENARRFMKLKLTSRGEQ